MKVDDNVEEEEEEEERNTILNSKSFPSLIAEKTIFAAELRIYTFLRFLQYQKESSCTRLYIHRCKELF